MIAFTPQLFGLTVAWIGVTVFVLGAVAVAIVAIRLAQPAIALFGLLPVGLGVLAVALRIPLPPVAVLPGVVALGLAALAVIGGNPITVWVLDRASRGAVDRGAHGGILVPARDPEAAPAAAADEPAAAPARREVLRGGTWIGYLERVAVVGAVVLGRFEIVAALIAVKGLGRFSELESPEARERFIIGTLASMLWAGVCAALIVLPGILAG